MNYSKHSSVIKYSLSNDVPDEYKIDSARFIKFVKIFRYIMNKKNKNSIINIKDRTTRGRCINIYNKLYNYILNLKPFIIKTNLKYNGKKFIGLPRPDQMTPEFIKTILNILKWDNSSKKISDVSDVLINSLPNEIVTKIYKNMKNCELTNGSISSQNQGNKSLLKQCVMPGLYNNMFRIVILPTDSSYDPYEIGLPKILTNTFLNPACIGDRYGIIISRQPILTFSSLMTTIKIRPVNGRCMYIHPSLIKQANADFDGDQLILMMYHGATAVLRIPMSLSGKFSMCVGFGINKLTFPQPVVVRMNKYDYLLLNSENSYGRYYTYVKTINGNTKNTLKNLTDTMRMISELNGSEDAYEFYKYVENIAYGVRDIFPIINYTSSDKVCRMIVDSGIQSSREMLEEKTTDWFPIKNHLDKIIKFCVEYLLSATNISNQYTSTIRIQQVLQNIYIDDNLNIVFRYDVNKDPMFIDTLIDFMEPALFVSNHTLEYILDN